MERRRSFRLRGAALAAAAIAVVLAQTGCGSSSPGGADPATVTPASAALYASFVVKPAGGPHGAATIDAQRLTHLADPYRRLAEALVTGEGGRPSPSREIEIQPWIGDRAAVFLAAPSGGTPATSSATGTQGTGRQAPGASPLAMLALAGNGTLGLPSSRAFNSTAAQGTVVLDTSSVSRARAFLNARAVEQKAHAMSYRGVRFFVSSDGRAEGVVHGFAVLGSASGVKAVIDTSLGGPALAQAQAYTKPPSSAIANAYLVPSRLAAQASSTRRGRTAIQALAAIVAGAQSVNAFLTAATGSLSLEARLRGDTQPLLGAEGAQALRSLPGGAWLAFGTSALHTSFPRLLALFGGASSGISQALGSLGAGGIGKFLAQLNVAAPQLSRSFARWAGPAALFASGTNVLELQAALAIDSTNASASRAAVGQLAAIAAKAGAKVAPATIPGTDTAASIEIAGFPSVIYVANGSGKLIVGLGQASVIGALHPATTLAGSPSYAAATAALGGGLMPAAIVEFPALLAVLEAIGLTQTPQLSEALPYLRSLGTLTAGSAATGSEIHFRAVLSLGGSRSA